ncbi:echinoidin-like [Lytechinus variegatus]|uniref:echinoidin-like n=1 Tax=Lytechinus variegatus TaxID=7654 RepID=UPI001BB0F59D|nr:echinoidin-like [Lytechinus variegatus]
MGYLVNDHSFVVIVAFVSLLAVIPSSQAGGCSCPPLWTGFGQNCYRFFSMNVTWFEAENRCRDFTVPCSDGSTDGLFQGHLVSVHSREEYSFLTTMYESVRVKRIGVSNWVWIGLHDRGTENTFEWIDGTEVEYTPWTPGQPNNYQEQDCIVFRQEDEYQWHDVSCDYDRVEAYICKIPKW